MIRLEGFHNNCATFDAGEGVAAGQLVTVSADGKVDTAASGAFAGMAVSVREGKALVQITGYMKVKMDGGALTSLAYGAGSMAAAAGGTAASGDGRAVIVTDKDTTGSLAGIILL